MKTLPVARASSPVKLFERLICKTVAFAQLIAFSEIEHSSRPSHSHKFFYGAAPVFTGEIGGDHTSIHNIKGTRGEPERLCNIHHLERDIMQPLHFCLCARIGDHLIASIDAHNFYFRVSESHF